ncbi:MAG: hypothetical protein VX595_06715 [Pseudomonadota bacterium]|nr:hypothetical protein [Pseudomonadota bacterium]
MIKVKANEWRQSDPVSARSSLQLARCAGRQAYMNYEQFLQSLDENGWSVPNKSFAARVYSPDWQVAFIRHGGRFQRPGEVAFVIGLRKTFLRDREKQHTETPKEAHDYPFKLTLEDLSSRKLRYVSRLLNYDLSSLERTNGWECIFELLSRKLPRMLESYPDYKLLKEIKKYGQNSYIEKIWVEDLT